jgi:hypothetical protein
VRVACAGATRFPPAAGLRPTTHFEFARELPQAVIVADREEGAGLVGSPSVQLPAPSVGGNHASGAFAFVVLCRASSDHRPAPTISRNRLPSSMA